MKTRLKEFDHALGLDITYNAQKEIQENYAAQEQKRQIRVDKYKRQIAAINERAFNTSLMYWGQDLDTGSGQISTGEELLDYINHTKEKVEDLYLKYQSTPTNMANNNDLIMIMGSSKGRYTNYANAIKRDFMNKSYSVYASSFNSQMSREGIPLHDSSGTYLPRLGVKLDTMSSTEYLAKIAAMNIPMYQAYIEMLDDVKDFDVKAKEVSTYSYNYEKEKYLEWAKRNNKKLLCGQLDVFIYSNTRQPSMGYVYAHKPQRDLWLKVLQTVPGGVIITGDPRQRAYNYGSIFVETSKSFADNQVITEPLVVEYKGFYDYVTVLGAKKRIYKFYRYGNNEIKANFEIPGQPFYFYSPY